MSQQPSTSNKLAIYEVNYTSLKTVKYIDFSKKKDIDDDHGKAIEHYIRDNYINEVFFKKDNNVY